MGKINKFFKRLFNGMNRNAKLNDLRHGFIKAKNRKIVLPKGVQYIYDDASHKSGRIIVKAVNAKNKTYYFGCGDRFTLYDNAKERDKVHKEWKKDNTLDPNGKNTFAGEKGKGVSSRIKRRENYKAKKKEDVLN